MSGFTINRVVLVGRLTRDPELRSLPSGSSACRIRIACNSARRDNEGEFQEKPNFFDVNVHGASAESISRHTRKGSRVAIDGRLEWREWMTRDQRRREAVSVVADTVLFLDGPGEQRGEEPWRGRLEEGDNARRPAREPAGVGAGREIDLVF